MSSSSYDLGIGIDPPSAAGGYLADDESILDDDLSFLQIAVTRMDSTLCEEMTSVCRRAAVVLFIILLLSWAWYSKSIREYYGKYVTPNYEPPAERGEEEEDSDTTITPRE
ncbi:hypothetical protein FOZ60_014341 [Perkinsus olseni]|uniref:Uncharacterized protein n=1 Tax=Perkinsus olseni TaxID=32597 RepID=A0A7J6P8D6_PEROL|nr:hypothetical protein FOZ60_014341 [Perkinsus olseni]